MDLFIDPNSSDYILSSQKMNGLGKTLGIDDLRDRKLLGLGIVGSSKRRGGNGYWNGKEWGKMEGNLSCFLGSLPLRHSCSLYLLLIAASRPSVIYISQFAASMNFQVQRPPLAPLEQSSIREFKNILDGVYQLASKEDQKNLVIVLNYLNSIIIKRFKDTRIPAPQEEENLTTAIYEKCLQIKKKNTELKMSVLDLRAVLRKMMSGGCQPCGKEGEYKKIVGDIRVRSEEVRAKLQKYRGTATSRPRLLGNEELRGCGVEELKRGAEWLQHRTIELRREVQTLRSYCLNQFAHRD